MWLPDKIAMMQAVLGEGPTWLEELNRLAFVDIEGKRIHMWDPVSGELDTISTDAVGRPSTLAPTREGNFLVVAIEQAVYLVDIHKKQVSSVQAWTSDKNAFASWVAER